MPNSADEVCRDEALLADVVSDAERVELVAADRQNDAAADEEGRRQELERVRVVDAEAIGALELEREFRGALARLHAPCAVLDVFDRAVVDVLADGAPVSGAWAEPEARVIAHHVVTPQEAHLGIEVVANLQSFDLDHVAIA